MRPVLPRRSGALIATAAMVAGAAAAAEVRHLRGWGATDDERVSVLPGDEYCAAAAVVCTRAVTIGAAPGAVWRWLMQIGQDRGGFYSYTWLENVAGCKMPEVHEIHDDWHDRHTGDRVWMATPSRFGSSAYNIVVKVWPPHAFVLVGPTDPDRLQLGRPAEWVWQFALAPEHAGGATRLIVRSRYGTARRWLEPIHFVMERKMLLTIADLAGAHATA